MILFLIALIVGILAGFTSFNRGRFFRRTILGQFIPAIFFLVEIGLGIYGWYYSGFLTGLEVFLLSWLLGGWLGMKLAKL